MNESDLNLLPDDVRDEIEGQIMASREVLDKLGLLIGKYRDDAVAARKESGIEAVWSECEEMYVGIDDDNRSEFAGARWAKPTTMEGPLTKNRHDAGGSRATAYIKLAARYVDAGTAKVCEIALPVDGKAFTLKPTPVPSLSALLDVTTPAQNVTGQPMPGPNGQPVTVGDLAKHQKQLAETSASKAVDQIYDWMVEYKHNAEVRKVVFDGARIGVGVLKGPVPEVRVGVRADKTADGAVAVQIIKENKPAARWLDPWLFFPAPGCGENIHAGQHAFELAPMLGGELMALADEPGYIRKNIENVIAEGPGKINNDGGLNPHRQESTRRLQYHVWHFHGKIPKAAFEAANQGQALEFKDELAKVKDLVSAIVTIVNDTVIRAILHPLESGRLPFHVFNWRRRAGHWAGVGVAEQVKTPQRIINAATRAMLNNAARSSGSQVVVDAESITPANGAWEVSGDKLWYLNKGSGIDDVRKAFGAFQWPNTTPQLMTIVEYAFKLAEEHSSIPLITQGQSGKTTPDTFSGQQLQDNNAQQLLRDVGFGLNDTITTPLVDQMYEWLLLDPNVPADAKGDFQVDTSGALALIEKALQDQTILAMGAMVPQKAFRIDPAKWFESWCRSKHMIASEFQYTDEEWAKIMSQPPVLSESVQVAQISAKSRIDAANITAGVTGQRIQAEVDRGTAYVNAQSERDQIQAQMKEKQLDQQERIANLNYQIKLAEFAMQRNISLEQAKTQLATTAMKLNVQKEISNMDNRIDIHKHHNPVITPPTEPAGRAEPGHAFEQ